jgi:hypothetical protein
MKAQAMRPPEQSHESDVWHNDDQPDDFTGESPDEITEADEDDLDDGRWDIFLLDDGDPLPEYGDFWFPD